MRLKNKQYILLSIVSIIITLSLPASPYLGFGNNTTDDNYLQVIFDDSHAETTFVCNSCDNNMGYCTAPSLYQNDKLYDSDNWDETTVEWLTYILKLNKHIQISQKGSAAAKLTKPHIASSKLYSSNADIHEVFLYGMAIHMEFFAEGSTIRYHNAMKELRPQTQTYILSNEEAKKVYDYLQTIFEDKITYTPFSHNCVDFVNKVYLSTGREGNILSAYGPDNQLNLFTEAGGLNLATVYAYYKIKGLDSLTRELSNQWDKHGIDSRPDHRKTEPKKDKGFSAKIYDFFFDKASAGKKLSTKSELDENLEWDIDIINNVDCLKEAEDTDDICINDDSRLEVRIFNKDTTECISKFQVTTKNLGARTIIGKSEKESYEIEIEFLEINSNEYRLRVSAHKANSESTT